MCSRMIAVSQWSIHIDKNIRKLKWIRTKAKLWPYVHQQNISRSNEQRNLTWITNQLIRIPLLMPRVEPVYRFRTSLMKVLEMYTDMLTKMNTDNLSLSLHIEKYFLLLFFLLIIQEAKGNKQIIEQLQILKNMEIPKYYHCLPVYLETHGSQMMTNTALFLWWALWTPNSYCGYFL